MKTLWLVGKVLNVSLSAWEFQGIFSTKKAAVKNCKTKWYFVATVRLNQTISHKACQWPKWANVEYPKWAGHETPIIEHGVAWAWVIQGKDKHHLLTCSWAEPSKAKLTEHNKPSNEAFPVQVRIVPLRKRG